TLTGSTGSTSSSSGSFTVSPAPTGNTTGSPTATKLSGPSSTDVSVTLAGAPFSVTQYVTLTLVGGAGTLLNNVIPADLSTGVATFSSLQIKNASSTPT